MTCRYVRIQGRDNAYVTGYPRGVFSICWRLIREGLLTAEEERTFRDTDDWFKAHLPEPQACREGQKVITFFKASSSEGMLEKLAPVTAILDRKGIPYDIVYTNAVGSIVYEDDWQIAVRVEDGKMV